MKLVSFPIAPVLLLTVLGLGLFGINRSLWLDEAWVANSVQTPTLHGMFVYPGWLQVNPPGFLLLVRAAVDWLGASNAVFRVVPLLLACAGAMGMLAVSRRLLRAPLAVLATALVVLDPTAIEYSRTLKPYSGELAASAILLLMSVRYLQHRIQQPEQPDWRRFAWLLVTVAMVMTLAYSTVFLLPGIVLAVVFAGSWRRAVWLSGLAAGELLAMYALIIRFNLTPELRAFGAAGSDKMTAGMAGALLFCACAAVRAAVVFRRGRPSARDWTYFICLFPCVLLAVSAAAGWYPLTHRTRLFALPCLVLPAMLTVEDLLGKWSTRDAASIVAYALAFGLAGYALADQIIGPRETYEEDFDGAVAFLQQRVGASDLILVHACCKEGFLLYSAMDHWNPPGVRFGETGWPCCARGKDARRGASSAAATIQNLDTEIPPGFTGRVWLLYTTRPTHWSYTGLDEGDLWRKHLWDRGCPPGPYFRFANLAVSPMNCVAHR